MATKPPSDHDIFLDDDESSDSGGKTPPAGGARPKASPTAKPASGGAPKKRKKEDNYDFDNYDYDGIAQALQFRLVKAPKQELEKISAAMSGLGQKGVTLQERLVYKKTIATAQANLKKIEKENKDFVKQNQRYQNLRSDSIRKLYAVREHKAKSADALSPQEVKQLEEMEKRLLLSIGESDLSKKDHKHNEQVYKLLSDVQKEVSKLPGELQEKFEELDERTAEMMKAQEEANEYLKEAHSKMRAGIGRAAMGAANFVGLGGIVRGVGKVYGAGKSVVGGVKSANRYMQARKIAGARTGLHDMSEFEQEQKAAPKSIASTAPIPPAEYDPDDPLTHPRKKRKSGKKLTSPTENKDTAKKAEKLAEKMAQTITSDAIKHAMETSKKLIQKNIDASGGSSVPTTMFQMPDFVGPPRPVRDLDDDNGPGSSADNKRRVQESAEKREREDKAARARHANGRFKKTKGETVQPLQIDNKLSAGDPEAEKKDKRKARDKKSKGDSDLVDVLRKHAASMERFNNRLLSGLHGLSKPASAEAGGGMGSMVEGLVSNLGGLMTKMGPLLGMAGKGGAVGGAFMAGHYVGSKIYEHYGDEIGQGVDKTSNFVSHLFGGETNDDKIEKMLKGSGPAKSGAASKANPQSAQGKVIDIDSGKNPAKSLPAGVTPSSAGGGRGSVNPTEAAPEVSSQEVSSSSSVTPVQVGGGGMVGGSEKNGSNGGKIGDHMGTLFSKSGGVDVDGVHPEMQNTLVQMGQDYFDATGKKINFNSAYRSIEEQEKLYRSKPPGMAAKPGSSLHNFGMAVDIPSSTANELDKLGLLDKYGFTRPIPNEKWHIQPAGISVASAKAGVYSADAPTDQGGKKESQPTTVAKQSAPSVTNAEYAQDAGADGGVKTGSGGSTNMSGGGGGSVGGTRVSASSIPTFDNTDGMFLALNTGII